MEINTELTFLSPDEMQKFMLFKKYFKKFDVLMKSKVFTQKGSAITIHFNKEGEIKKIDREDHLYLSGVDFENTNG